MTRLEDLELPGVGPSRRGRLLSAGIRDVEALAALDPATASVPGLPQAVLVAAIEAARAAMVAAPAKGEPPSKAEAPAKVATPAKTEVSAKAEAPPKAEAPAPVEAPPEPPPAPPAGGSAYARLAALAREARRHAREARATSPRKQARKQLARLRDALSEAEIRLSEGGAVPQTAAKGLHALEEALTRFLADKPRKRAMEEVAEAAKSVRKGLE
jgi:hypothetical protein